MRITSNYRFVCFLLAAIGLMSLLVGSANAATLMEDTFDYAPGPIDGSQNGGFGWGGAWTAFIGGGESGFNDIMAGSIAFSSYPTVGNRVRMGNTDSTNTSAIDRQYTRTERTAGITKDSGDLWMAFLYQRIDESGEHTDQWVELRNNSNFALGMTASAGNSFDYTGPGQGISVRYDNIPEDVDDSASAQDGRPYLMIGRFTKLNILQGDGIATMWALEESDYAAIVADGSISAAELDANHYLKVEDTAGSFIPQKISVGNSMRWVNGVRFTDFASNFDSGAAVDGFDFLTWQQNFGTTSGATQSTGDTDENGNVDGVDLAKWEEEFGFERYEQSIFDYDELRYGDALTDVVMLPPMEFSATSVPEPSTLALAGFALLMLYRRGS